MNPRLSIVIPFHNEEGNIAAVLDSFLPFVGRYDFELICVNDASTDQSAGIFKSLSAVGKYAFMKCIAISKEAHRGYGRAIMSGVREARGEVIAWTHSDMQANPADVFRAFDEYVTYARTFEAGSGPNVIVKGRRIGRALGDVVFSLGMATVASVVIGKPFFEINAQPKLFHRNFLSFLANAPDDFSLDLYALYQAKMHGYGIMSIPVRFHKRVYGVSSWSGSFSSKIKTIRRAIKYIFKLKKSVR